MIPTLPVVGVNSEHFKKCLSLQRNLERVPQVFYAASVEIEQSAEERLLFLFVLWITMAITIVVIPVAVEMAIRTAFATWCVITTRPLCSR
jgi:hypothetical protein